MGLPHHRVRSCRTSRFRGGDFTCETGRGNVTLARMHIVGPIVIAAVCAAVVVIGLRWSRRGGRQLDVASAIGAAVVGLIGLASLVNVFQSMVGFVLLCLSFVALITLGILYVVVPGWLRRPTRSATIRSGQRNSRVSD